MYKGEKFFLIVVLFMCMAVIASSQETKQTTFTGRVIDTEGKPVAGATVKFYDGKYTRSMYTMDIAEAIETTSDADGRFSLIRETDFPYGYIVVEKEGLALDCAEWNKRESQEFEFKLGRAEELAGIIVDENGEPVSDAEVGILTLLIGDIEAQHSLGTNSASKILSTVTDDKGRFSFINLPADAGLELMVKKAGRATVITFDPANYSRESMSFSPGQKDIRITQPIESKIEGIVVNKASGQPVAGADLIIRDSRNITVYGQDVIASGEDGSFSINNLTAGNYKLIISMPRKGCAEWVAQPVDVTLEAGQVCNDIKVELSKGGLLEVHVTESGNNKPLEEAYVSVYSERDGRSFSTQSDNDGIARMRLLPGVYRSGYAYMEGYSSLTQQDTITIVEGSAKRLEWQLSPMPVISGVVRDENDKPIEGASLVIIPGGGNEVKSDSQGKYKISWDIERFSGEEQEIPLLVCRYAEGNLAKVIMVDAGTKILDIKLNPGITIRGKVADPLGKPIADARIRIMLDQTMWASTFIRNDLIKTDAEGNFEVSAVPAEQRYRLNVSADGYGSDEIEIHADDAVDNILDLGTFNLPIANLTVSGIVVDIEGNPIVNTQIESYDFEGNQPENLRTQTDSQGRFTFDGVCEGQFDIRINTTVNGKRIRARAIAFGGASDIKIIASEGTSSPLQYFRSESDEEILQNSENVLAGIVVDGDGSPVSDVPVGVCCVKSEIEPGRYRWMFSDFSEFSALTGKQGRFVIPLDTDNEHYKGIEYNLRISPQDYAANILYDIPVGTKDIKVVLSEGGSLSGKLVRIEKGEKVPIANAEVKLEQESRAAYTHLGFDRDKTTITDSQGRFKFVRIQTKIRPDNSRKDTEWEPVPRVWLISYGQTSESVAFYDGNTIDDFELIVNPTESLLTVGNALPSFDGIVINLPEERIKDKMMLVCFWDYQQRPSRNCILLLSKKEPELKSQGIQVVAIHASNIEKEKLDEWIKENEITFPVGMIQDNEEEMKLNWGVKSLPRLILTDKNHIVTDEGFNINELDERITTLNEK